MFKIKQQQRNHMTGLWYKYHRGYKQKGEWEEMKRKTMKQVLNINSISHKSTDTHVYRQRVDFTGGGIMNTSFEQNSGTFCYTSSLNWKIKKRKI